MREREAQGKGEEDAEGGEEEAKGGQKQKNEIKRIRK